MSEPYPIAIAIADLHLSLLPPACRADKDWMGVQAGYLQQVKEIACNELTRRHPGPECLPILCAGDIFDKWNVPPELINFALEHLPDDMMCVPGQHDLPLHRTDLMHRSGYGVLKQAGKIRDLSSGEPYDASTCVVRGFGWEQEVVPLKKRLNSKPHIALIHRYVFLNRGTAFPNAPAEASFGKLEKVLRTYDAVCIGDNHIHWMA